MLLLDMPSRCHWGSDSVGPEPPTKTGTTAIMIMAMGRRTNTLTEMFMGTMMTPARAYATITTTTTPALAPAIISSNNYNSHINNNSNMSGV